LVKKHAIFQCMQCIRSQLFEDTVVLTIKWMFV